MHISARVAGAFVAFSLLMVFVAIAGYALHSMVSTRNEVQAVSQTTTVSRAYDDAGLEILLVRLAAEAHLRSLTPETRADFDSAVAGAVAALDHIALVGDDRDRAAVASIYSDQLPALEAVKRFFLALERGEPFEEELPSPDIIDDIEALMTPLRVEREEQAETFLVSVVDGQEQGLGVMVVVCSAGFALVLGLLSALRIASRREARHQVELNQLRTAALTDSLTGLGNHRAFVEELKRQVARATRYNEPLALAMIDVDEFKEINDTWGHGRGDAVLRQVAVLLESARRAEDYAFRIGGDEFALILTHAESAAAVATMERIRMAAQKEFGGTPTLSIGVATAADSEGDESVLRQQADSALYDAKLRGRNTTVAFTPSADSLPVFPAAKVQALRNLLAHGEMNAAFQPIWGLTERRLFAHEALARIPAPYDLPGPQLAFDIAERIGRSAELDAICRKAILHRAGQLPADSLLFVNISPYSLSHSSFSAPDLVAEFRAAGIEPSRVVLEITERSNVSVDVIEHAVIQLRAADFKIALDDAGSGNAGLQMLRRVPVDFVKIDRSVLTSALQSTMGRAAVMAIVAFASQAGALVVAEGVESDELLELVRWVADGGDEAEGSLVYAVQGYLLGHPAERPSNGDAPAKLAA